MIADISAEKRAAEIVFRNLWIANIKRPSLRFSIATAITEAVEDMRQRKDVAYEERNRVVAALARLFPSGITKTDIPGWDAEWHGCVYIDTPVGQLSWHFHDSQAHLFDGLPSYEGKWDGHTTEEKYERLSNLDGPPDAE